MPISNSTKFEASAALVGAVLGAMGAILFEPVILSVGAILATTATILRIVERDKKSHLNQNGPTAPQVKPEDRRVAVG